MNNTNPNPASNQQTSQESNTLQEPHNTQESTTQAQENNFQSSPMPSCPLSFVIPADFSQTKLVMNRQGPLIIKPSTVMPIVTQPQARPFSGLQSPRSIAEPIQPPSLFLQALSKINENSLNAAFEVLRSNMNKLEFTDIPPPDSLASAPPSYSFVLRQMAARRRPRLMGTFIPSPSFVQHTPPPTYATAFDIYVDPVPSPPPRVYNFGFSSMPVVCPECGFAGMTVIRSKITICTHTCAFLLCVFCCWLCAPLPYVLKSCKDVYHHCRNCRSYLGMYCPTNPSSAYM